MKAEMKTENETNWNPWTKGKTGRNEKQPKNKLIPYTHPRQMQLTMTMSLFSYCTLGTHFKLCVSSWSTKFLVTIMLAQMISSLIISLYSFTKYTHLRNYLSAWTFMTYVRNIINLITSIVLSCRKYWNTKWRNK